jgi:hypothetical protein
MDLTPRFMTPRFMTPRFTVVDRKASAEERQQEEGPRIARAFSGP